MIKKFIAFGAAGAALLVMAIPTLACTGSFCFFNSETNSVSIKTDTQAISTTGNNQQINMIAVKKASDIDILGNGYTSQSIISGNAYADAKSLTIANADPCGCFGSSGCLTSMAFNAVSIEGKTLAGADSGLNAQQISTEVTKAHDVTINPIGGSSSTISSGVASSIVRNRTLVNVMPIMWN